RGQLVMSQFAEPAVGGNLGHPHERPETEDEIDFGRRPLLTPPLRGELESKGPDEAVGVGPATLQGLTRQLLSEPRCDVSTRRPAPELVLQPVAVTKDDRRSRGLRPDRPLPLARSQLNGPMLRPAVVPLHPSA